MLLYGLQKMHSELIQVPRSAALKPRCEYLEERFARFRAV